MKKLPTKSLLAIFVLAARASCAAQAEEPARFDSIMPNPPYYVEAHIGADALLCGATFNDNRLQPLPELNELERKKEGEPTALYQWRGQKQLIVVIDPADNSSAKYELRSSAGKQAFHCGSNEAGEPSRCVKIKPFAGKNVAREFAEMDRVCGEAVRKAESSGAGKQFAGPNDPGMLEIIRLDKRFAARLH